MKGLIARAFIGLCIIFILGLGGLAGWGYQGYQKPGPLPTDINLVIPHGMSVKHVINHLKENGVIENPLLFLAYSKYLTRDAHFQSGEYRFPANASPKEVIDIILSGKTVVHRVTIAEGLMTTQILQILAETEQLKGTLPEEIVEGELLPETYHFSYADSRESLVERMQKRMKETLAELWEKRQENHPLTTLNEVITLASIVEKETGVAAERKRVAAVFLNRLKKRMRLQADPTTIYAITKGKFVLDRPLTREDLKIESPYNTYKVFGLPPGPIANPGKASIEAVLQPIETKELYFVADGNGGHVFASTLKEHNKNVQAYRKKIKKK